jgi:hypothetical protein
VLPRSLPRVIVIVNGNFDNHDNPYGYLLRSERVDRGLLTTNGHVSTAVDPGSYRGYRLPVRQAAHGPRTEGREISAISRPLPVPSASAYNAGVRAHDLQSLKRNRADSVEWAKRLLESGGSACSIRRLPD